MVGHGPKNNPLDFNGDLYPDQDLDPPGIFKRSFWIKFLVRWAYNPKNSRLDFGGDAADHAPDPGFINPDRDRDPGILKGFFIYCCDSYKQRRIKHDNPTLAEVCTLARALWFIHNEKNEKNK